MRRRIVGALLFGLVLVADVVSAYAGTDENTAANRLIVETVKLVNEAAAAVDAAERADLYRRAIDKLDEIVDRYPGSDHAARLATSQPVGNLDREAIIRAWMLARAEACVASRNAICVLDIALEIPVPGDGGFIRSNSIALVAQGLANTGAISRALETADAISASHLRAYVLGRVAVASLVAGSAEDTAAILGRALDAADAAPDRFLRALGLVQVAISLAEAGDPTKAAQTADQAIDASGFLENETWLTDHQISMIAALAGTAYTLAGEEKMARGLMSSARVYAQVRGIPLAHVNALSTLAVAELRGGDREEGSEHLRDAVRALAKVEDGPALAFSLREMLAVLASSRANPGADLGDRALGWAQDWARFLVADAQVEFGDIANAQVVASRIEEPFWRLYALATIMAVQNRQGSDEASQATAQLAFEVLHSVEDGSTRAFGIAALGFALINR